jgi:WD40 repeat protein
MRPRFVIGLFVLLIVSVSVVSAQDDPLIINSTDQPYPCPYTNSAYYQAGAFPRYDVATASLILADSSGNPIRVLEPIEQNVRIINWSPDCRYLSGIVGAIRYYRDYGGSAYTSWNAHDIVIWDTVSGERTILYSPHGGDYPFYHHLVIWSPDSVYALTLGGCHSVHFTCTVERQRSPQLWNRVTNVTYAIADQATTTRYYNTSRAYFNQVYWDTARQWLWGDGVGAVIAYDLTTGSPAATFENGSWTDTRFAFSPDNTRVIAYSIAQPASLDVGALAIYNIGTGERIDMNVEGFAAPYIPFADYHPVALSADNRYLAVGYDAIRVWDLQNLPAAIEDRLPIYRHGGPDALIESLRFSADGVIETTSGDGVQNWDMHTGVYVP